MPKRKARLPVAHKASRKEADPLLFLEKKGCKRETLLLYVNNLRVCEQQSPSNEYKLLQKALNEIEKAQRVIENLPRNKAVQFACGENLSGAAGQQFSEAVGDLLGYLATVRTMVGGLVGPSGKQRRLPPMPRIISPKYFFDIFLWSLVKYVKETTGKYYYPNLCELLSSFRRYEVGALKQRYRRAASGLGSEERWVLFHEDFSKPS